MSVAVALAVTMLTLPSHAGSGPWVLSEGETSVYLGAEAQRIDRLTLSSGMGADDVLNVDDGIETTGVKGVVSHGIRKGVELELDVPWARVDANRPDGDVCALLGPTTCARTQGLAPIRVKVKGLVLDAFEEAPGFELG